MWLWLSCVQRLDWYCRCQFKCQASAKRALLGPEINDVAFPKEQSGLDRGKVNVSAPPTASGKAEPHHGFQGLAVLLTQKQARGCLLVWFHAAGPANPRPLIPFIRLRKWVIRHDQQRLRGFVTHCHDRSNCCGSAAFRVLDRILPGDGNPFAMRLVNKALRLDPTLAFFFDKSAHRQHGVVKIKVSAPGCCESKTPARDAETRCGPRARP